MKTEVHKGLIVKRSIDPRRHSRVVVDGVTQAPARAMLRAVGFRDEDFARPQIGVSSTWAKVTPCNMHIGDLAREACAGVDGGGGKSVLFNTITVSDGISMGTPGMRYSLVSREIIADSIEAVAGAAGVDCVVAIGGCVYGGTIRPGAQRRDIISVFEAVGAHAAGKLSDAGLLDIERTAIPGPGSCAGMYTANTMASAIEALGLSLPGSSAQEAVGEDKRSDCRRAGEAVVRLVREGLKPRDILTRRSFENAITVVIALGGSTNAVLHLLAIAHEARVRLELDDFTRIGRRVPVLADLKPSGRYLMSELVAIGGIQPLMKMLLGADLLHPDCLTVTGHTLQENLEKVPMYLSDQDIVRPLSDPLKKDSHLVVLYGNLAPEGAVAKITGKEGERFEGPARVFEGEERATQAILAGRVRAGDVVVIRQEGPRGGPGMREMLSPTSAIMGRGLGAQVALITDGRFSGGSHGFVVGHISPEAAVCGPIGLLRSGDRISIDAARRDIHVHVPAAGLRRRRAAWRAAPRACAGPGSGPSSQFASAHQGLVCSDKVTINNS